IPDAVEPDPVPPKAEDEPVASAGLPSQPAIMPYCDDSGVAPERMPYAEPTVWPTTASAPAVSQPWFEESEPIEGEAIPVLREDQGLARQYPAGPDPGPSKQPKAPGRKPAVPARPERDPFLPVLPEVPGPSVVPSGFEWPGEPNAEAKKGGTKDQPVP